MFEAKVVTSTRPVASPISARRVRATSLSEKLSPSRRILVESQMSAVDALVAERAQPRFVDAIADARVGVDLPVPGMHGEPRRRADGQAQASGME